MNMHEFVFVQNEGCLLTYFTRSNNVKFSNDGVDCGCCHMFLLKFFHEHFALSLALFLSLFLSLALSLVCSLLDTDLLVPVNMVLTV